MLTIILTKIADMDKIVVVYGSTTGTCESLASRVAEKLGTDQVIGVADMDESVVGDHDVLVLGSSTWGDGELQDDWYDGVEVLKRCDLAGKKVALFGCGDSASYPDTFCNAMALIRQACEGATLIGAGMSTEGYSPCDSESIEDGHWIGCALDEVNESDQTEARLDDWIARVKAEM